MSWTWTKNDVNDDDPLVVRQIHEEGCGAACAVMLLADRGLMAEQLDVAARLRLPCTGAELAARLNELSHRKHQWIGGSLDLEPPLRLEQAQVLGRHGSWAAQLIPNGFVHGHWVVIDTVSGTEVGVRDPIGQSYRIPFTEFGSLFRHMVTVLETGGR